MAGPTLSSYFGRAVRQATLVANSTVFPLSSNVLFPARAGGRVRVEFINPPTNHAVTLVFSSGFTFVLQPGGSYLRTVDPYIRGAIDGAITATGTAGETLQAEDAYLA